MYETYITTKRLINKEIKDIENEEQTIHTKNEECFMMLLIAITKLIINKEDIVHKNKTQQTQTLLIPEKEINDIVKRGIFKIYDTPTDLKRTTHQEKKIKILDIKEDKKNNSAWIIDNIRDSLAHNKFKINYETQTISINNTLEERKLKCEIDFYWIIRLSFILSNNRIENNTRTLKLTPYIYYEETNDSTPIKNINQLDKLFKSLKTCMIEIQLKEDIPEKKLYETKNKIRNIWEQDIEISNPSEEEQQFLIDKYFEAITENKEYNPQFILKERKLEERLKIINKYCKNIKIIKPQIGEIRKQIEENMKTNKSYFKQPKEYQKEILIKELATHIYNYDNNEKTQIEDGLDSIMSSDFFQYNKLVLNIYKKNQIQYIVNKYCNKEEKLLSALYLLGTTTFMLYKEKVFDKEIDYTNINIKKFENYDIESPKKIETKNEEITNKLLKKLTQIKQCLGTINKLEKNKQKSKEKILPQLTKQKQTLYNLQQELKIIKQELEPLSIKKEQIKIINNKKYINVNQEEFMRHLRNALAHTWIYYKDNNSNLMDRIVEIRDYNDKQELVYICRAPYKEWLNLFNNKTFENAIKNYTGETNSHQLNLK